MMNLNEFEHQGISKHSVSTYVVRMLYMLRVERGLATRNNTINFKFVPCTHIILHWKTHSMFTKALITGSLLGP